jgi:hypothetical protein
MKQIEDYKVLSGESADELTIKVNHYLNQGYVLNGELKTAAAGTGSILGGYTTKTYSQAVVLYEGERKQLPIEELKRYTSELEKYNGCMVAIIFGGAGLIGMLMCIM